MKNTQSEIKLIKLGKKFGTTYSLGCKDYLIILSHKKQTIKVPKEKTNCVVCQSSKSRLLKQ